MSVDTKLERDTVHHLARIAAAVERIADTLQRMADNDPLDAISKALDAEAVATAQAKVAANRALDYGADLPESERWRLGK